MQNLTQNLHLGIPSNGRIYGWVDQPSYRGTIDIIWMCLTTTFIATYTVLCLNVPSRGEPWFQIQGRRLLWMGVSIAGPEFTLTAAAGQWKTARTSVKLFSKLGYKSWTMRHGFFTDMGGLELRTTDFVPFLINSRHLYYLVSKGYMEYPEISLEEIRDKSKQDNVAKIVTLFQVAYLILQCIGRAVQHLAITTLELFSLAIVVTSIATTWCWLHKPADIGCPLVLSTNISIKKVIEDAGERAQALYQQTPLDFVDDLRPSWCLNVQAFVKMPIGPKKRPIPRFGNERFPDLNFWETSTLLFATFVYAAIHVAAWNWTFPTKFESIMWRVSSMILLGSTFTFWALETIAVWYRYGRGRSSGDLLSMRAREQREIEAQRPNKELPLVAEFWSILPLAVIYAFGRGYLLIEAFAGLRALEESAYISVNWAEIMPHI
ncbi:MAG: hypothetical protein M1820_000062 [Bogoriella megaspora]|nr:MAG: hypothetical protein M1820_000062 [Bogoriella megaspora]